MRAVRVVAGCATGALLAVGALLVYAPQATPSRWLSARMGVAQALAFPLVTGVVLLAAALVFTALSGARPGRRLLRLTGAVLALLGAGLLLFPDGPPWADGPAAATSTTGRTVTVTVLNSMDTLTAEDVRRTVETSDPDVLVLPEASPDRVADAVAGTPLADGVHTGRPSGFRTGPLPWVAPTAVVVHPRLGAHHDAEATPTTFGAVRLEPEDAGLPTIIGVHTAPPVPAWMDAWRADLTALGEMDRTAAGLQVVAGDLNATDRHGALAGRRVLADAAVRCPDRPGGTWPAEAPELLRAPIDHVLITPDVEVVGCGTLRVGAGDHLAFTAELRLPQR